MNKLTVVFVAIMFAIAIVWGTVQTIVTANSVHATSVVSLNDHCHDSSVGNSAALYGNVSDFNHSFGTPTCLKDYLKYSLSSGEIVVIPRNHRQVTSIVVTNVDSSKVSSECHDLLPGNPVSDNTLGTVQLFDDGSHFFAEDLQKNGCQIYNIPGK